MKIMENLCDSANNGGEGTHDVLYLPTNYEPQVHDFNELQNSSVPLSFKIPATDQDVDDLTLGEMLTETHRQIDKFAQKGVSQSVVVVRKSINKFRCHTFFSEDIQTVRMVDGSGQPDERNSSNEQIRTLLEEQRQTIIAEYREKVSHHELHAAHAEEERRLLQGQLWRQKLEFREAHQQSLTEMEELRKFQSSTFDTIARRKLVKDQNTIMELSGRVQELQNEVNCMNDSKDFRMLNHFAVAIPTFPVDQCHSRLIRYLKGC